jgi:hypothetical protein
MIVAIYLAFGIVVVWLLSIPHRAGRVHGGPIPSGYWIAAGLMWPICVVIVIVISIAVFIKEVRNQ